MNKPAVLVTFDSMKNRNTGYYYFGKGLGNALLKINQDKFHLSFYLHKRTKYPFAKPVPVIRLSKLHRFYFPYKNTFKLVHITDQECRLQPGWVNAKKIMTIHDLNRLHVENGVSIRFKKYLDNLKRNLAVVDKVVAISHFVANDIVKIFPETAGKLSVIYNGADKLLPVKGHTPVIAPAGKFLFTIGILTPQKGFHYLPCLLQDNDLSLIIAGIETPHKYKILEEAKKYGCQERVMITGPVTDADKVWYYQNCRAFVFPSIAEGFGLPVIEAMHFGKPVFLARQTSLPEIGGKAAYYFDNFEPGYMRKILQAGLTDFDENDRAKDIIKQAEKFNWDTAAEHYLNLYQTCLNNHENGK